MKSNNILVLLSLLILAACGGDSGGGGGTNDEAQELVEAAPGTYYSVLRPVNFHANGFIPYGAATFTLKDDQLQVNTSMDDDQAVTHRQSLHMGTRCPTSADDTNGDSFIDYNEALAVVGSVLMPLDSELSSQSAGAGIFPKGSGMTYSETTSLSQVNADLWKADENPSDNIIKLASGQGIGLEGRVVLVHGTTQQSSFPTSLSSHQGEPAYLSMPVVCGVLSKIE